jgi:4-hydroxybenzoyl-CoA reductase subunit beta
MNNMRLPTLTYSEPKTIKELMELKGELKENCAILAGGTDIIPMLKRRNLPIRHLINIKRIPELTDISYDKEKRLRIGTAVTLREIVNHPLICNTYPLLAKAALAVGFNHLRNMGTLGGNICLDTKCAHYNQSAFWWKSRSDCFKRGGNTCYVVKGEKKCFALSAADTVSALIALDAEIVIVGPEQQRRAPAEKFYTGDGRRPHRLDGNEVVTAVLIPPPAKGWKEGFLKKSHRGWDFSIATLSIRLRNNSEGLEDVRIALNGVSSKPIRAKEVERYLMGKAVNHETMREAVHLLLKQTTPLSLIGVSAFVRRKMIEAMFVDLIEMIAD